MQSALKKQWAKTILRLEHEFKDPMRGGHSLDKRVYDLQNTVGQHLTSTMYKLEDKFNKLEEQLKQLQEQQEQQEQDRQEIKELQKQLEQQDQNRVNANAEYVRLQEQLKQLQKNLLVDPFRGDECMEERIYRAENTLGQILVPAVDQMGIDFPALKDQQKKQEGQIQVLENLFAGAQKQLKEQDKRMKEQERLLQYDRSDLKINPVYYPYEDKSTDTSYFHMRIRDLYQKQYVNVKMLNFGLAFVAMLMLVIAICK